MYDNILSPTDSSEGAAVAFDGVRDVAETYDATAHVLYTDTNQVPRLLADRPGEIVLIGNNRPS